MRKLIVPNHRICQVVAYLYENWSDLTRRRLAEENESKYGCYAIFCVNGIYYFDTELNGRMNTTTFDPLTALYMDAYIRG